MNGKNQKILMFFAIATILLKKILEEWKKIFRTAERQFYTSSQHNSRFPL